MKYSKVYLDSIGYELPPVVVTSSDLEDRLMPMYEALRFSKGQLEALTGISERRWWEKDYDIIQGAVSAARKTLAATGLNSRDIEALIYASNSKAIIEIRALCQENSRTALFEEGAGLRLQR